MRVEVERNFRYRKFMGSGVQVQCPYHISDTGFSQTLNINLIPHTDNHSRHIPVGMYHCWSCGAKGIWNTLAHKLNMELLEETDNYELASNVRHVEYDKEYVPPHPSLLLPLGDFEWHRPKDKKTITNATLRRIKARMFYNVVREQNDLFSEQRLWLPCYEDGEIVGHIGASLDPENVQPKYLNADGGWALTHFFLWDPSLKLARKLKKSKAIKRRYVVIVEGPADALVLYQEGIPAVSVLGTNNWTEAKANLVAVNYDYVFVLGDGDDAGRKMGREIKKMLVPLLGDRVRKIRLDEGDDPAKLKKRQIRALKELIEKYTT